jgi:oligopeptide/dipeptide ABC transporter ATP-binding protein
MTESVLDIHHLGVEYVVRAGRVRAVDDVSLSVRRGETLGLVGESGCGKSTLGRAVLRLVSSPGEITDGEILFQRQDLLTLSEREMARIRGKHISMVFQDPMTSLNPLMRIDEHIIETIRTHERDVSTAQARERAAELIDRLGITAERLADYPHQLSGGMRQRVMIGLALALNADVIIADEPTTSLDVLVEAQFLDLLEELQSSLNLTIILITHNIGIVAQVAHRVAVMYAGKLIELGEATPLFGAPLHPYTQGLLASVPNIQLRDDHLQTMDGSPPDLIHPPQGCRFHPRCPRVMERCRTEVPPWKAHEPERWVACWLY